ncbi:glycosyltransferase family 2 protein [Flammeovirga sp. OC4]|uniref:glycosyltransferase family 2 protein n=1 Tax=Flammeovirga sp. OC4 TaxID=1382345 RepID=UPI0005C4D11A|nr:glycosyltransferase family 2 protein [Flammeovirga sp. OC4]
MKNKKLTLVFGFKNREIERVRRCLSSLANQTVKEFTVLFIDYGSDLDLAIQVKRLVNSFTFCRYIYNDTRGKVWNRSHALNTGIKLVDTEYVMTTDIDLVYPSHFIASALDNLHPNVELHSNAYSLPAKYSNWRNLFIKPPKLEERNMTALGLAQGVETSKHFEIRGFDEYYRIWGVEDHDLSKRLEKLGTHIEWMTLSDVPVYHQWHPSSGLRTRRGIPHGWQKMMGQYMEQSLTNIKRSENWGQLYFEHDRRIYSLSNDCKKVNLSQLPSIAVQGELYNLLLTLSEGEGVVITFEDRMYRKFNGSRLQKFIRRFNDYSNTKNYSLLLESDLTYFGNYENVYVYRDQLMYFLLMCQNLYSDYFFTLKEDSLELKIIR